MTQHARLNQQRNTYLVHWLRDCKWESDLQPEVASFVLEPPGLDSQPAAYWPWTVLCGARAFATVDQCPSTSDCSAAAEQG